MLVAIIVILIGIILLLIYMLHEWHKEILLKNKRIRKLEKIEEKHFEIKTEVRRTMNTYYGFSVNELKGKVEKVLDGEIEKDISQLAKIN